MKTLFAVLISVLLIPTCYSQQDLLPAYPREIRGDGTNGNIAYYIPENRPFTGIVVDEKTTNKLGEYLNGYRNGIFTEYFTNGKKKSEGRYSNGSIDGKYTEWFENGNKKNEINYYVGEKINGTYIEWFSNGQIKATFSYHFGVLVDGEYTVYLEDGQIEKKITYSKGIVLKEALYENGQIKRIRELITEYYPNGKKKSEYYQVDGKEDGLYIKWYDDGQEELEGQFENGLVNGKFQSFFKNGQKRSEGVSIQGMKNGVCTFWDESGNITSSGNYINDTLNGEVTFFDKKTGTLKKAFFKNGKKDFSTMNIVKNCTFTENSTLLKLKSINPDNNILVNIIIESSENDATIKSNINTITQYIFYKTRFQVIPSSEYGNYINDTINYKLYVNFNFEYYTMDAKDNQTGVLFTAFAVSLNNRYLLTNYNGEKVDEKSLNSVTDYLRTKQDAEYKVFSSVERERGMFYNAFKSFVYKNFPVNSYIVNIDERNKRGDATMVTISGGNDIGIYNPEGLFSSFIFNVYDENNSVISTLNVNAINSNTTSCKVKKGGDIISSKSSSGIHLKVISAQ